MKDLSGRTAFVTGGANGIGRALAGALLAEGCNVAIADIRQDALDATVAELGHANVMPVTLDVASRDAFVSAADRVERELGPVSLLFNNAGVNLFRSIDESTYEDWDWVVGVNLNGVIHGIMTFVPRMKSRGGDAHIVNTASMAAFFSSAVPGIYNTTKFAVRALSESLRYSLHEHGIGVSLLCPGLVDSAMHRCDELNPAGATHEPGMARVFRLGMDPATVAERVLNAIRENRYYIFTHPEHKSQLRILFDEIIAAYPEGKAPAGRASYEARVHAMFRQARARAGLGQDDTECSWKGR